jgi:hypothetical protein
LRPHGLIAGFEHWSSVPEHRTARIVDALAEYADRLAVEVQRHLRITAHPVGAQLVRTTHQHIAGIGELDLF